MALEVVLQGLNEDDSTEDQIAIRRVRNLLRHVETELPGSRGFGLSPDYLDEPPDSMKTDFAADLYDKIDQYVPDVDIQDIQWESLDAKAGKFRVVITLERRT